MDYLMGQFIKLPGVAASPSRPKVDLVDSVVPDSGALLLLEPAHPMAPWPAGVPAAGGSVPNVVGKLAAPLIGADTSLLGATIAETDPTNLIIPERTSKGAIHLAVAQAPSSFPSQTFWRAEMATAIKQYLLSNPTHSYYMATTARITRLGLQSSAPFFLATVAAGGSAYLESITANQVAIGTQLGFYPARNAAAFLGAATQPAYENTPGTLKFADIAAAGWTGAGPSSLTSFFAHAMQVGRTSPVDAGSSAKYPSVLFYRTYLEDLSVSKRTWAQVNALEYANYQRQFAAGGRYAGDTWTDPAALVA
jgi:hypothetical protein